LEQRVAALLEGHMGRGRAGEGAVPVPAVRWAADDVAGVNHMNAVIVSDDARLQLIGWNNCSLRPPVENAPS